MFGVGALYHRGDWGPSVTSWLQRLDQLMIFVVIAGTATPPIAACLPAPYSLLGLETVWSLAVLAAAVRLCHRRAPAWLSGASFVSLGGAAGVGMPAVWMHAGVAPAALLLLGVLLYTAAALAYRFGFPNPYPAAFGYYEIVHLLVCAAAACQYVAVACFLL
ncbi:MAG: hemolysin III family protein [Sciscionella sp.]